jgi:hypothetical protein
VIRSDRPAISSSEKGIWTVETRSSIQNSLAINEITPGLSFLSRTVAFFLSAFAKNSKIYTGTEHWSSVTEHRNSCHRTDFVDARTNWRAWALGSWTFYNLPS